MFSDSMTTIEWIRNWNKKHKSFENFRIKRIRLLSKENEWRYVPTLENPADYASRGLQATDTKKWKIFHFGPEFLKLSQENWPIEPVSNRTNEEQQATFKIISAMSIVSPLELTQENGTVIEPEHEYTSKRTPWPLEATAKLSGWSIKVRRIAVMTRVILKLRESARSRKGNGPLKFQ